MPRTQSLLAVCLAALLASAAFGQAPAFNPSTLPPQLPPVVTPQTTVMPTTMGLRESDRLRPPEVGPQFRGPPPQIEQPTADAILLARRQQDSEGALSLPPRQQTNEAALPLAPRGQSTSGESSTGGSDVLLTTLGSLALVLCLFFAAAYVLRRGTPHALAALPGEVVEILGRAPLPGRNQMHLVRCGHKLLLVSISTAGADTLTEITDPAEVDRLCGLCRQGHPHSATAAFRNVLNQFGGEADMPSVKSRTGRKTRMAGAIEDGDA